MEIQTLHQLFLKCTSVTIDTRKIAQGSLFVALKGESFDANTFASEALEKGASFAIIDNKHYYLDERTILVENTLDTLQKLAQFHREYLNIPIIALTGSNGKTTTKELLNAVLSKKYDVKATVGNLNNHIGVPLTLLSFDKKTEIGIVEMGANHQEEIAFLCAIAQPDYGYITNFGKAHLEGFGGIQGVIKGKSEMYQFLRNNGKKVFINLDDAIQAEKSTEIQSFTFSNINTKADVFIDKVQANPYVAVEFDKKVITSQLVGIYNASNISAAICVGTFFNVKPTSIKEAIEGYQPTNNRSQLTTKGTNQLLLDAYNANPSSMKVALEHFLNLPADHKVAFLGDMFELGEESYSEHAALVSMLKTNTVVEFYFVGKEFYKTKIYQDNFYFFASFDDLKEHITQRKFENKYILIKGSRGMALERLVELLT